MVLLSCFDVKISFGDVSGHKKYRCKSQISDLQVLRHRQTPINSTNGMTRTYTGASIHILRVAIDNGLQFGDFQVLSASKSKHSISICLFSFLFYVICFVVLKVNKICLWHLCLQLTLVT